MANPSGLLGFVSTRVPGELAEELQLRLLRSHACGVGEPYPDEIVRAALLMRANTLAKHLAYGDQRRLEIARALATEPKLLALDEPAAGMNATETASLKALLANIRRDGTTILLIEHDMKLVMSVCDRVLVLDYGKKIAEGSASEVQANPNVIAAYLGGDVTLAAPAAAA